MTAQKTIAWILVLAAGALVAGVTGTVLFPGAMTGLAILGLQRRHTLPIQPHQRVLTSLLVLILLGLFSVRYHVVPPPPGVIPAVAAWQTISRFFFSAMVLVLFLGDRRYLPASLGAFFLALVISAGQVLMLTDLEILYRPFEFTAVILAALYACTDQRHRPLLAKIPIVSVRSRAWVFGVILLFALNSGWMLGAFLYRHQGSVTLLSSWVWGAESPMNTGRVTASAIGFDRSGRLHEFHDILQAQDDTIQLRLLADHPPPYYLRGEVFENYDIRNSQWVSVRPAGRAVFPDRILPGFAGRRAHFDLSGLDEANLADVRRITVSHEVGFGPILFSPLGVLGLQWNGDHIILDDAETLRHNQRGASDLTYGIEYSPQAAARPSARQIRQMLHVSSRFDPRIAALAQQIVQDAPDPRAKIDAVVDYFRQRYRYSLDVDLPADSSDRLTGFLLGATQGYCEYFASGAAVLLRLVGVPTRYVTGFLATEHEDDQVLVRARDAHAWVEAWDSTSGQWITVEATPQQAALDGAVTDAEAAGDPRRTAWLRTFLRGLYEYGLAGPLIQFLASGGAWGVGSFCFGVLLLLGLLLRYWLRASAKLKSDGLRRHRYSAQVLQLQKLLQRADRALRRWGLSRGPAESLERFAARLQNQPVLTQAARWYQRYTHVRFAPVISDAHVAQLTEELYQWLKHPQRRQAPSD